MASQYIGKSQALCLKLLAAFLLTGITGLLHPSFALAQITPDTTWGSENSVATPGTIGGQAAIQIAGGAIRNTNLFHSFQSFNVADGQRVYFTNPAGIQTILARVTGNSPSNILGTLGVDGAATLFLINPSGVVFGSNSRLDVRGSLVTTTAHEIQFGNQGIFRVSDPQAPALLTINPSALWFTQTTAQPIIHRSIADGVGLQAATGQSVLFVGGDVQFEGGRVLAPGGRVELAGVGGQGIVPLQAQNNQWRLDFPDTLDRANVSLSNGALVNVRSQSGGDIIINAKNFTMTGSETQFLAGINAGLGSSNAQAGNIEINATESAYVDASLIDNSVLRNAIGNGGTIQVNTDSLLLTNGAQLTTNLVGVGNLGDVMVNARKSVIVDEIGSRGSSGILSTVAAEAAGNSSNITITTGALTVKNGAVLSTILRGRGKAGDITMNISDTAAFLGLSRTTRLTSGVFSFVQPTAVGNTGKITVNAGSLFFKDGASFSTRTSGRGDAGDILINVRDQVVLDGIKPPPRSVVGGLSSIVFDGAIGNGGNIVITAGSFVAKNGAALDVSSSGRGNAGNVTIIARETVVLDGTESRGGFPSGIFSSVERFPVGFGTRNAAGDGGTIRIIAKDVFVTNGARIEARISDAPGKAGSIIIEAERVNLTGASFQFGNSSGLFIDTIGNTTASGGEIRIAANTLQISEGALLSAISQSNGRGGNIQVDVEALELRSGGQLVTTAARGGNAGDIVVTARDRTLIEGNDPSLPIRRVNIRRLPLPESARFLISTNPFSGLLANTEASSAGQGGTISLETQNLLVQNGGQISAASQGSGAAGQINIAAHSVQLWEQGRISAETVSATGGDLNLNVRDILLLRRNSIISTTAGTAGAGGNGGNIRINAGFVVAHPQENSDITANAFSGRGGRVDINTLGLFGFTPRTRSDLERALGTTDPTRLNPQRLPTSDITAISQTSPLLSGSVAINTPNLDPTQALVELPAIPVDMSRLINQELCAATEGSQFVVTGRGGLPDAPTSTLNPGAVWEDWRVAEGGSQEAEVRSQEAEGVNQGMGHGVSEMDLSLSSTSPSPMTQLHPPMTHHPSPISSSLVEAQSWTQHPDGSVWLIANPAIALPAASWLSVSTCRSLPSIP